MQFKDIENQTDLINRLTEIIDSGRVGHAQMFEGATRDGALALAIAYAQYLGCQHREHYPEGSPLRADSCGCCPSCMKYQSLQHPDLHFFFPNTTTDSVRSNPSSAQFVAEFRDFLNAHKQMGTLDEWYEALGVDNKQGMIRESDADDLIHTLSLQSYEGGAHVAVIWMPEKMNISCANTILKTLEEPSSDILILLVSEQSERMLPTILSRVQRVRVPHTAGVAQTQYPDEFAPFFVRWMRLAVKLQMGPINDWVEEIAKWGREQQKRFLLYSLEAMNFCVLRTATGQLCEPSFIFGDEKFDTAFFRMISPNNIELINTIFNDAIATIGQNGNPKICFMTLSFKLSAAFKKR